ncbi:hypothetical protein JOM56_000024 [Amanita muscaria]
MGGFTVPQCLITKSNCGAVLKLKSIINFMIWRYLRPQCLITKCICGAVLKLKAMKQTVNNTFVPRNGSQRTGHERGMETLTTSKNGSLSLGPGYLLELWWLIIIVMSHDSLEYRAILALTPFRMPLLQWSLPRM